MFDNHRAARALTATALLGFLSESRVEVIRYFSVAVKLLPVPMALTVSMCIRIKVI